MFLEQAPGGAILHSWPEKPLFPGELSHCSKRFGAKALPLTPFSVAGPSESAGDVAGAGKWRVTWLSSEGGIVRLQ